MTPTIERVRHRLAYDPLTGVMTWRVPAGRWGRIPAGTVAGSQREDGYRFIFIDGRSYLLHRVIWFYVNGRWPENVIDHRDGNPDNNRLANLRDVTQEQNAGNQQRNRGRTVSGAFFLPSIEKWRASIRISRKNVVIGYFDDEQQARDAYDARRAALGRPPVLREGPRP